MKFFIYNSGKQKKHLVLSMYLSICNQWWLYKHAGCTLQAEIKVLNSAGKNQQVLPRWKTLLTLVIWWRLTCFPVLRWAQENLESAISLKAIAHSSRQGPAALAEEQFQHNTVSPTKSAALSYTSITPCHKYHTFLLPLHLKNWMDTWSSSRTAVHWHCFKQTSLQSESPLILSVKHHSHFRSY